MKIEEEESKEETRREVKAWNITEEEETASRWQKVEEEVANNKDRKVEEEESQKEMRRKAKASNITEDKAETQN